MGERKRLAPWEGGEHGEVDSLPPRKGKFVTPPSEKKQKISPPNSKKLNRSKKRPRKRKATNSSGSHEGHTKHDPIVIGGSESLVVTVDGRGSKTIVGGQRSAHPISPQRVVSPPINHVRIQERSRPPLLITSLPASSEDYPREPHPYHTPYGHSRISDHQGHLLDSDIHRSRMGVWHHGSPGHTPSPSQGRGVQGQFSRSFSSGDSHLPAPSHRRYSEHLERHNSRYHDSTPRPQALLDTPTSHTGHMTPYGERGSLSSSRGFLMSEQTARQTGLYPHHRGGTTARRWHGFRQ